MAPCHFCKVVPKQQLKSCVCRKVSYCSKECQAKDWKSHKPSCRPFTIKEAPGKGKGLFAKRNIQEGEIILEEYPLFIRDGEMSHHEFKTIYYPIMDKETKAKILQLHDPAEDFKKLDRRTAKELIRKYPILRHYKEAESDEMNRIFRIIDGSRISLCNFPALYSDTEIGLYNNIDRINHSCVANASWTWVMGDFKKKQVRAIMNIEKGQEITVCYLAKEEFFYGSTESRRQQMLERNFFLCQCAECSLEGEELQERDGMRAELRLTNDQLRTGGSDKKVMKLAQKRTKLLQKLSLRALYMSEMLKFYVFAVMAKKRGIPCENEPEVFKQEALKYAKILGDDYLHFYNTRILEFSAIKESIQC